LYQHWIRRTREIIQRREMVGSYSTHPSNAIYQFELRVLD